jgi:hypothetical protein
MIVKVLEAVFKTIPSEIEEGGFEEVAERLVPKRMEIAEITEYAELINQKTKKPYKKRCLLRSLDQWVIVNHSFDELTKMKDTQSRITVKGFFNETTRQGNRKINRSRKK